MMVLPTKHLRMERSLLGIGADLISLLHDPMSESQLWIAVQELKKSDKTPLTFEWYILAISMLYSIGVVELRSGRLYLRKGYD